MTKLKKLQHPMKDHELWVDMTEVVSIERKNDPVLSGSSIIRPDAEPPATRLTLKSGKQLICLDLPDTLLS